MGCAGAGGEPGRLLRDGSGGGCAGTTVLSPSGPCALRR